jgi:ribosome-binding protein aMBF1 (putative translation factor)
LRALHDHRAKFPALWGNTHDRGCALAIDMSAHNNMRMRSSGTERAVDRCVTNFDPELLRQARTLAGLTAAELAERAGLSLGQIVRFENGLKPSADSWQRIEKALRVALDEHLRAAEKMRRRFAA